jgi:hypothetical protein
MDVQEERAELGSLGACGSLYGYELESLSSASWRPLFYLL